MDRGTLHCVASITPTDTELDRLGGKTHLLAELGAPDSGTCVSSSCVTVTGIGSTDYYFSDVNVDSMHPTLAQDMRSFDMGAPTFNNLFDFPTVPITQSPVLDMHSHDANFYPISGYQAFQHQHQQPQQQQQQQPPAAQFEQPAPILDATWQSFVEQLGF